MSEKRVETAVYDGKVYRRYPRSKRRTDAVYFKRSLSKGKCEYLHRRVWEDHNGPIPEGFHIHHRDDDPGNNAPENLEAVSVSDHLKRHPPSPEQRAWQEQHLAQIRHLTKGWHSSEAGRAVHKRVGALAYAGFKGSEKACSHCGSAFTCRKIGNTDKFCSNACKSAWRRDRGIDDVQRDCLHCGEVFTVNKYSKRRFCCRSCVQHHRWKVRLAACV